MRGGREKAPPVWAAGHMIGRHLLNRVSAKLYRLHRKIVPRFPELAGPCQNIKSNRNSSPMVMVWNGSGCWEQTSGRLRIGVIKCRQFSLWRLKCDQSCRQSASADIDGCCVGSLVSVRNRYRLVKDQSQEAAGGCQERGGNSKQPDNECRAQGDNSPASESISCPPCSKSTNNNGTSPRDS